MKKVLTSFGFGPHSAMLEVAMPTFTRYAQNHNYDLFIPTLNFFSESTKVRPCSWWKVELIQKLFVNYDRILWIDSDAMVCRFEKDIFDDFSEESHVGMVVHEVPIGKVPNCGIWLLDKKCMSWFPQLWQHDNLPRSDGWWEQDAMLHMLGIYSGTNNITLPEKFDIPWTQLDYLWNPHVHDHRGIPRDLRFFHATMIKDRVAVMKDILRQINFWK